MKGSWKDMLGIDHIVIAAKDPAQSAQLFGETYNCKIVKGGRHENWGTFNYLAYFRNDCYIEWLGIFNEEIADQSDNPLIKQLVVAFEENREGPIQYALRTEQMNPLIERLTKLDYSFAGPIAGEREKPDGTNLQWRMLFPESESVFPFIIEWGKQKNIPNDREYINNTTIQEIQDGLIDLEEFEKITDISVEGNNIPLRNGKLTITSNNKLDFTLQD
ncbi:VOC family protein [Virgibacillus halodenitrificans]|nr:VOC family protein [Virgibacillus halodenitrificans]MCG1027310.1 VOC family protein [Virgibacillus halodenitrificans]